MLLLSSLVDTMHPNLMLPNKNVQLASKDSLTAQTVFEAGPHGKQPNRVSTREWQRQTPPGIWHLGGTQVACGLPSRNLLVSILCLPIYIPHPFSPTWTNSKASMPSSYTGFLGLPQKGPPTVESKQHECGLSLSQRPRAYSGKGRTKCH